LGSRFPEGEGLGKMRGWGGSEKWRGREREDPKLLLNQGPQSLATPLVTLPFI